MLCDIGVLREPLVAISLRDTELSAHIGVLDFSEIMIIHELGIQWKSPAGGV